MSVTAASPTFPCQTCEVRDQVICSALGDAELRELNTIATSVKLRPGQAVFFEGDESAYLFNVVTGAIRLSKLMPDGRRQIVGFLFSGDVLGLSIADVGAKTAYIVPGSPWENGYCESFNARFRDELLNGEIFYSLKEAQIIIEEWRKHYNTKRPHSALGYRPPAPETIVPMDPRPVMH